MDWQDDVQLLASTSTKGGSQRQEFGEVDWYGVAKRLRSSWSALPQRVGVSARSLVGGLDWIGKAAAQLLVSASTQGGSQRQEFGLLVLLWFCLCVCIAC